uniref:Hydroxysteroid 17-beta dehydrogenase 11 n=1 Tax=Haemonchus contortus TaxID=6289 RepID=A0A7I4Z3L0_HAECO
MYNQWSFKILSTIGILIHLLLIDIPKDIIRWITLKQKNVDKQLIVITGGASGLGRCMAKIFSLEKRARTVILDVNLGEAEETVASIVGEGGQAYAYYCDISNDKEVQEIAKQVALTHGKVDIVVCNAAVLTFALFKDLTVDEIRQSLDVNVLGTINTIRAFIGPMEERNSGHIVAVSSIAGFSGETFGLAYCPTKFAVRGVMECLQMELRDRGREGVICSTLCPYFSRTPMVLRVGLRPKCTWFPFMSVESCSRRMVDAILKEKCISFMPNYVSLVAMMKGVDLAFLLVGGPVDLRQATCPIRWCAPAIEFVVLA